MLHYLTVAINFGGLLTALWLGLYLVRHAARRTEVFLSALAFWSLAGFFYNELLALNPPPVPPLVNTSWLNPLTLFYPRNASFLGSLGWLQGWLPTISIIFWYQATLYMLPGGLSRQRRFEAFIAYGLGLAGVLIQARASSEFTYPSVFGDPLFSNALRNGPLFPLFVTAFVILAGLGVYNLAESARSAQAAIPRQHLRLFINATLLGGAAGLLGAAASLWNLPVPQILVALLLCAALLLAAAGFTRYHALPELPRDFFYNAAEAFALLLIYLLFYWTFSRIYSLPAMAFVFVGCLAMISHSLVDLTRLSLDRISFSTRSQEFNEQAQAKNSTPVEGPRLDGQEANNLDAGITPRLVELALRNLHDYAYLADSPLAELGLVSRFLSGPHDGVTTHIERGKALCAILIEAVRQLSPAGEEPGRPLPRTWHPYIILRDAYLEDQLNQDIMSRLYLSEGTFNRTRRATIYSVARILEEMEACVD